MNIDEAIAHINKATAALHQQSTALAERADNVKAREDRIEQFQVERIKPLERRIERLRIENGVLKRTIKNMRATCGLNLKRLAEILNSPRDDCDTVEALVATIEARYPGASWHVTTLPPTIAHASGGKFFSAKIVAGDGSHNAASECGRSPFDALSATLSTLEMRRAQFRSLASAS